MIGRRGLLLGLLAAPVAAKAATVPSPRLINGIAGRVEMTVGEVASAFSVPPDIAESLRLGLITFREARQGLDIAEAQLLGEAEYLAAPIALGVIA